ncbi:ATP-binding protein [Methylovulum psychrotolerans]|uniref:Tetratricopeptide repeat-containing protein n=1 Tax=Methylovulum psychrotolerans TaxID=1704499 RepID=A0A2S5CSP5_9GAMM|nr:ATP-binding protein [Methylovulum psychrotolerans]POZ53808.1 tetratricopeptide repeat-containing protein [Methylovulum psychrotolerans]
MSDSKDPTLNLYNPASQTAEQLLAEFVDRKGLLARILAIIQGNTPERPQQHLILIGPRGMGKTTLLCAIQHSIERDPGLNAEWLPIVFQEEQYGIGDLADFWLECLRHLQHSNQAADQLLAANPADLAQQARQVFFDLLAKTGKRAVLLIDNLNDIFTAIDDGQALHSLRALWMTDPRLMVIGAAPSYFAEITAVDEVFHDFFRSFSLERLSQAEFEDFLRRYADIQGDDGVLKIMANAPERVAALRILTGGNPRLLKLGYRVLRDGLDGDLRHDLERMLDEATPFFKHRIDALSKEARRTFDAIARRWDPVTVDDIRQELRKPSNNISVQIKRLIDEGFVEEAFGSAKKKSYQVSERFYNVYYLMRHSREGRRRLRWLVGFMQTFYSRKDYKHWAQRLEGELSGSMDGVMRSEKLAHLQALCAAADDDSRCDVFEALVRDAIAKDDRRALDEEINDGDPVEKFGFRYLMAEMLWWLDKEQRQALGFKPNEENWYKRLRVSLIDANLMPRVEEKIADLQNGFTDSARYANALGGVFLYLLGNYGDAEAAYCKALELDADSVNVWGSLGNALNSQRRYPEAEAAYRKALELDADSVCAWNNLGNALNGQLHYSDAEAAYRKALEFDADSVPAWSNLGNALNEQGRYSEAESAVRKALELDADSVNVWGSLGNALNSQRRYPEAEAAYRKALELDADSVKAWNNLGSTLERQGRYPEAEAAYRKALELDADSVKAWNNLGSTLERQGRYPEAEAAYRKTLELDSNHGYAHNNLAGLYLMDMHLLEAGVAELLQGLQLDPCNRYGCYVLSQYWQAALAPAVNKIIANSTGADNLCAALTEELIAQAATGAKEAVLAALLALEEEGQAIFEPLLLALQAMGDRTVLYRIAREKRDVVLDVMARIDGL